MPPTNEALSAQQLQLFIASLSGLAPDEIRKAKSLYLRNAISEYKAVKTSYQSFGQAQGCFALIPFFWPFLKAQRATMDSGLKLHEERITNALTVWKEDLGDEFVELQRLLAGT